MMMNKFILSAPFGNYLDWPGYTSTLGTFTLESRGRLLYRLWRCALTLRPSYRLGGWVNRLGLPNPGIYSLETWELVDLADKIVSIHGFDGNDWASLEYCVHHRMFQPLAVELNLSCPNVRDAKSFLTGARDAAANLLMQGQTVIAKLPPVRWWGTIEPMYEVGVRYFHCCNTIPTPSGGLSGKVLKQYSLWCLDDLRQRYGSAVTLIGGGGVTCIDDVSEYVKAGADHIAVGSAVLNPLRWGTLKSLPTVALTQGVVCP